MREDALRKAQIKDEMRSHEQRMKLAVIALDRNPARRMLRYLWHLISFPFVWLWREIRDWRTFLVFAIVVLLVGSEVWVPAMLALIGRGTAWGNAMWGVASAGLLFWNVVPGTPFIGICIVLTIGVKGALDKIRFALGRRRLLRKSGDRRR